MNYATIKYCDIANGTGVRTSLFVSGCRRHCPECFNAVAWDFGYGLPFDKAVRNEILGSLAPDYIDGLSLLGGEPFEPENQRALVPFLHEVRVLYPHKTIWCYTGNVYETELLQPSHARCEVTDEMLSLIDVLVDGEFIPAQHDISLRFRGSSNQRIIDAIKKYLNEPDEKFPVNITDHGNSSSASCLILLDECNRKGMFQKGDILVFSAFGAGLLSGAAVLEW